MRLKGVRPWMLNIVRTYQVGYNVVVAFNMPADCDDLQNDIQMYIRHPAETLLIEVTSWRQT